MLVVILVTYARLLRLFTLEAHVLAPHVPTSLLLHDCLPRLVDSLLATSSSPGSAFQASSRAFLSLERVAAENGLGWHPNTLRSRFVGTEDDTRVEVQRGSDEFRRVECIFKADPAPGVDRFYFPNRGTSDLTITKIERVQNRKLRRPHARRRQGGPRVGRRAVRGGRALAVALSRDRRCRRPREHRRQPGRWLRPARWASAMAASTCGATVPTLRATPRTLSTHAGYGRDCLDDDGCKMLLLCLVECGLSCVGEEHMRIMPKVHPTRGKWRQLTYVDYASNPEIFVVGRGEQVYPAYIIHFS